jgi:hypothetical protein
MQATILTINYPNGSKQVVRPNPEFFKGNFYELAQAIGAPYFPRDQKVQYEVR